MAIPSLLGSYIDETYQRLVQTTGSGTEFADGLGNPITFGTTAPAGPNTSIQFNGNGVFSGSNNFTYSSGSNAIYLTGSLNITGSNTIKGYTQFMPVSTNIDNSISASYIYVSGSTNDLYFTQNNNGYANTTRLRWIEGNLYTGLLNGGIISTVNSNTYKISSGSGIIVNLNATYNDNPYPVIKYINWENLTNTIDLLSGSYDQQFVAINTNAQITASGIPYNDGDYNTLIPIGIVIHQNRSTINAAQTFPSVAYGWKQRSFDFIKAFGPLKISGYTLSPSSSLGLSLAGGTSWVDGRNYIVDPSNPSYITEATGITTSKIYYYHQSGSGWAYNTNAGAGYSNITASLYSNNGVLNNVPSNNWSIQRVFYFPNSATKAFYIYFGNAIYANKADAIAATSTEPFSEAPNTAANAIFVGYMILRDDANFTTAASYEFRAGGLFRGISGGGGGTGGGTTSPGGSNTQIQYNNNGAFGGVTNLTWNGTTLTATGSFTGSFTGSLFGSASYATTSSYALNGGVTQLLAGPNISLSPSNGLGQVTITSTGGGTSFNTATGSYGSFYSTQTQTAGVINTPYSMSFNNTDISNGVAISGSSNALIKITNAGVYDLQFSSQLNKTGAGGGVINVYIWLRKNNIDLASTNTIVQLQGGANSKIVAAWNWFLNAAAGDYYQIMWATDDINGQLYYDPTPTNGTVVPSVIATVARVDQFLSNTGSFSGAFNGSHTGSFTGSFTGSLLGTASFASTSSNILGGSATYIPLWNTNTTLSSSVMYQSSSNIGIGTTSPGAKLDVSGNTSTTNTAQFGTIGIQSYAVNNAWFGDNVYFNGTNFIRRSGGYAGLFYFQGNEGQFRWGSNGSAGAPITNGSGFGLISLKTNLDGTFAVGDLGYTTGDYTGAKLIVNSSGNVGIGTTTPVYKLDVSGSARLGGITTSASSTISYISSLKNSLDINITGSSGDRGIRIYATNTLTTTPNGAAIQFFSSDHSTFPGQFYLDSGADNNAALIFRTAGTGGTITERMRVNSSGNVGIGGIASPSYKLEVSGTVAFSNLTNSTSAYVVGINNSTGELYKQAAGGGGSVVTASINEITLGTGSYVVTPQNQEASKYTTVNIFNFLNFS